MNLKEKKMEPENDLYHLLVGPNKVKTAFELPQSRAYFNKLEQQMLLLVKDEEIPGEILSQVSKTAPYQAPAAGYFKNLPVIFAEKMAEAPAILPATIKQPGGVPGNYFENLPFRVLEKTRATGKVVRFALFKKTAVAAAILVAVVTGWMVYTNYSPAVTEGYNMVKKEMKNISGAYIDTYVAETEGEEIFSSETTPLTGHNDFKKLMQSVPDNVIDHFLEAVDKGEQEEIL